MIKVYIDWNVMSQMKNGHYAELLEILKRKDQLAVVYSTSHISDILVSYNGESEQNKRLENDLTFIQELTDSRCAHLSEKEIKISALDPRELFEDRVQEKETFSENGPLIDAMNMFEPGSIEYEAIKARVESPLPEPIATLMNDPKMAEKFEELYPGLRDDPTLGNLVRIGWLKNKALTETDQYKNLRIFLQQGLKLNKDKMFAMSDPFKDVDKVHADLEQLTGTHIDDLVRNDNSPDWFQDITHNYLLLDMHGYQQDKIRVDERNKDTMRNTIDDGLHAAFASTCDFYITNDSRSLNKTKQVYQKLALNTRVFTAVELVDFSKNSLMSSGPAAHLNVWLDLINQPGYIEEMVDGVVWRTYFLESYLFDYFNKVSVLFPPEEPVPVILLRKEKPTNFRFITDFEIRSIINKLDIAFEAIEPTIIDLSQIVLAEGFNCIWVYRDLTFRLQLLNGYLQLYMDIAPSNQTI
jgi:hypothetical protein